MGRKIIVQSPTGEKPVLDEVPADDEHQLQELLKAHPELLPLDDLGLTGPALVVGRESSLDSGRVDLVLLGNGGDLALVEFKTGPQNPDFRECLAQLVDYGADLWEMSLEDFDVRVAQRYFAGPHYIGTGPRPASLEAAATAAWGTKEDDAVDWRERLQAQLRDGSFHYVAVAQRFTLPVLRTIDYLNETMKAARFSAVELVRFSGAGYGAFEARFVAGARAASRGGAAAKTSLAGVDDFVAGVLDDEYRHALEDLVRGVAEIPGMTVVWGTTGCSLRVPITGRSHLSVGWLFPPGPPRWMGLRDVTLGWYEDANGLALSTRGMAALAAYGAALDAIPGGAPVKALSIRGRTFGPDVVASAVGVLVDAVREVTAELTAG